MRAIGVIVMLCAVAPTHSFMPLAPHAAHASSILSSASRKRSISPAFSSSTPRTRPVLHTVSCSIDLVPPAETRLLELVQSTKGRGKSASQGQLQEIQEAITELETVKGVNDPISSPLILGSWELLYTSKSQFDFRNPLGKRVDGSTPGIEGFFGAIFGENSNTAKALTEAASSSPIQRTVTSIDGVLVSQDIILRVPDARVDQRVTLNKDAYLRLSASASTSPDSTSRINFTFDLAYFQIASLRIPYPVPFKLLGDEAKGWLDTTYLSQSLRISRGNKGTTFILRRLPTSKD